MTPAPIAGSVAADSSLPQNTSSADGADVLLCRLASRLCIAARGQDVQLDALLTRTKQTVRTPPDNDTLSALINDLSDAIAQLPDPEALAEAAQKPDPATCARLLQRLVQLRPEPSDQATLDRALALLGNPSDARWPAVEQALFELAETELQRLRADRSDAEQLLNQVGQRLSALSEHLQTQSRLRDASMQAESTLNDQLRDQMSAMGEHVEHATSLAPLQQQMRQRLQWIDSYLSQHREQASQRESAYGETLSAMQARIEALEKTAQQWRIKADERHHLALTDPLTQIPNRLAYEQRIAECLGDAQTPTVLLLWDVDHFKQINDNFGHPVGDKVLRIVARLLAQQASAPGLTCRYGGEEFAMLLKAESTAIALTQAERIRQHIAGLDLRAAGKPLKVTVSCGLTMLHPHEDAQAPLERADRALYQAKQSGRNRCIVAEA